MNANANINIRVNGQLKVDATDVLRRMGLDMSTAVNLFLTQIVLRKGMPFEITTAEHPVPKLGGWEGKVFISDDFNDEMEEFEEYM